MPQDERRYARIVSEYFATQHEELAVSSSDAIGVVERLGRLLDEPLADMSFVPLHLLSCAARRSVTVALTGDGGDELFAGYPSMAADRWHRTFAGLPRGLLAAIRTGAGVLPDAASPFRDFLAAIDYGPDARNQALIGGIPPSSAATLLSRAVRSTLNGFDAYADVDAVLSTCATDDRTARLIYRYCKHYLAGQNLVNSDRASMATGLELRAPFLDHTFVEFLGRIPSRLKLPGFHGLKRLLKRALADRLPPPILRRGKQGFGVPFGRWFRGPMAGLLRETLAPDRLRRGGLFDPNTVGRLVDEHIAGSRDHDSALWSLLVFELWRLEYLGPGVSF
jgi:asparagine synthase (glutamine-hydrolysing)